MCVKQTKVARLKMAVRRVNMRYSAMETVELVLNEGSDPEDFSDSGSEENIVDSGEARETAIITSSFSSLGSVQPVG